VGLLSGPGVAWELKFGSWMLLQPERINTYAQAVIQTIARMNTNAAVPAMNLGVIVGRLCGTFFASGAFPKTGHEKSLARQVEENFRPGGRGDASGMSVAPILRLWNGGFSKRASDVLSC
jgi:hypothetical protein